MTVQQRILVLKRKLDKMIEMNVEYDEIVKVSQKLDKYIVMDQKSRYEKYLNKEEVI